MAQELSSSPSSEPGNPQSHVHLWRLLKWTTVSVAVLALLATSIWTVQMMLAKGRPERTKGQFVEIAIALQFYSYTVAERAYTDVHPIPATGLSLEDVPWGSGHLPFPVRRAGVSPGPDWLTQNGEGEPLYSWRLGILPFIVSVPLSWDASGPWNTAGKREQLKRYGGYFSYDRATETSTSKESEETALPDANALAITGTGTAFGDGKQARMALKDVPPNTILVVECRASGIPWPAPGDFDIRTMPQTINAPDGKGISSRDPGGFHVIFADWQVWRLSDKVPLETLKKFFTVGDAKENDREKLLGPYVLDRAKPVHSPASNEGNSSG